MLDDGFYDPRKPLHIRCGDLPHWRQDGALYFVTFRLADSLPEVKLAEWRREREKWQRDSLSSRVIEELTFEQRRRIEQWLDRGLGSCLLRIPAAKRIVETAIRHFEGERYELGDSAVAPNHVHVLVRTASGIDLSSVLHSWKRHSSREIRKLQELQSVAVPAQRHLWQVESFDHIVRDRLSLDKFSQYIRNHEQRSQERSQPCFSSTGRS